MPVQPVHKAVIPAAGYGTRMLPITKTVSKEILPLVDKPIIQYVVEELVTAGITDVIIVTSSKKADLVDYFSDVDAGLLEHLKANQKHDLIKSLENVHNLANIAFVEQKEWYGNGFAVLAAAPYISDEPFIFSQADDFFVGETNVFRQLLDLYEQHNAPVLAGLRRTAEADYDRYGYVGGQLLPDGALQVTTIAEHPGKANAPGDLALFGGYVVTAEVWQYLHRLRETLPAGQELYFNYSFNLMIEDGKQVLAKEITDAQYFDTGNKLEYMKTCVAMAARHPDIGADFQRFLQDFRLNG